MAPWLEIGCIPALSTNRRTPPIFNHGFTGRLEGLNIAAVGISPDPVDVQKKFDTVKQLYFPLLSDADHAVAGQYGVWEEKTLYGKTSWGITRSSFLIDEKGRVIEAWYKIKPEDTVPNALKALGLPATPQ